MNCMTRWVMVCSSQALVGAPILAQSTTRVSVAPGGLEANSHSGSPALSADGRFVAFQSLASNLVAGDTNSTWDVFVYDRLSAATDCVSVDSAGVQGNSTSWEPSISADGRFVAFQSFATNLVAGDTNANPDVFVHDRQSGTTERVSVDSAGAEGDSNSGGASISADGRFVAFESFATNLVAGDANGSWDVFVRDRQNGTTEAVSVDPGGAVGNSGSDEPSTSADGRFVAFRSFATNLVAGDTNGELDIFVRDRQSGTTERVSVDSAGVEGNSRSQDPWISADGLVVAFLSLATNLVAGDSNAAPDIFVHDSSSGATECASVDSAGTLGNSASGTFGAALSADGGYVAFWSVATNLVSGDSNACADIFVHGRQSGSTTRASVDSYGSQANEESQFPSLSGDGRFVAFLSAATFLVLNDTNASADVFLRDQRGPPPPSYFCFGDMSAGPCPCGNYGMFGGCQNSAFTGGAMLVSAGTASLAGDTLVLSSWGELPSALSVFLQGDLPIAAVHFGDGLRCTGGALKRLYVRNALDGVVSAPAPGSPSISARSAALGDALGANTTRYYQTYYRDPSSTFCPAPSGSTWNISSGLAVVWGQ